MFLGLACITLTYIKSRSVRHVSWYFISASGEVNLAGARGQLIVVVDMEPMCRNSFGTCKKQTADRIRVGQIVVVIIKQEQYSDQGVACFTNGTNELHLHQPSHYVLLLFTWTVLICQPNSALWQPRWWLNSSSSVPMNGTQQDLHLLLGSPSETNIK
jgi:hypothetical protein